MSSFLCFVCHSTVNADTNEETREKYREVIGMNLCPDSHLCYICCYFLNKMCMFKSICLKRSLEYPVLFSEKGTINLHRSETSVSILCPEDICLQHLNTCYHYYNNNDNSQSDFDDNNYCELQDDRNFDINDTLLKSAPIENFRNEDYLFVTKDNIEDNIFNEELILPNLEPVRITQNDLVNGKWTQNVSKSDRNHSNSLLEFYNYRNEFNIGGIVVPPVTERNNGIIRVDNSNSKIVLTVDEKNKQTVGCAVTENFQDVITNQNLNFNPHNHCYEQLENDVNENIENNIFENDQSNHNKTVENTYNESETNLNESVTILNENVTNMNEDVSNISENVTNINENVTNINDNVRNISDNVTNINENVTNINENVTNVNENITNINENVTNINDNVTNINDNVKNINENGTNIIETVPNSDKAFEEATSYDSNNPSDIEESHNSDTTDKKIKSKKSKKKDLYDKVFLTLEDQKAELDKARKDDNYLTAIFKCHSCAMYFHFKDTYQTHMMRHEESNGEHSCSMCSLRFANPAVLRSHIANHGVRYKCRVCSAEVRARQRPTHERICVGKRDSVNCHLCGRIFQCGQHFQQHMQRYHASEGSNKNYLCNVCGKSYSTRGRVRTHMITHINRKFECDSCTSTFSSPYTLQQHKKLKHVMLEPQVHHCASCNIAYNSRKSLLAHMRNALAHKETVYKCNICGRSCPTAASLARHTASVHTRARHLVCRECHKRYSTTKALVRHMSNHKVGKPVPLCHSCGITFKSTTILKRHLKNVCEKDTRKCQTSVIDEELLDVPFYE